MTTRRVREHPVLLAVSILISATGATAQPPPEVPPATPAPASPVTPPRPLEVVEPEYPPEALATRLEAALVLRLTIDAQGQVQNVEVVERTAAGFDDAARAALLRSRFTPATRD